MRKEKELLRKQLELLAEQSESAVDDELVRLSTAMCGVYRELKTDRLHQRVLVGVTLLSAVSLYLLTCILVHV